MHLESKVYLKPGMGFVDIMVQSEKSSLRKYFFSDSFDLLKKMYQNLVKQQNMTIFTNYSIWNAHIHNCFRMNFESKCFLEIHAFLIKIPSVKNILFSEDKYWTVMIMKKLKSKISKWSRLFLSNCEIQMLKCVLIILNCNLNPYSS